MSDDDLIRRRMGGEAMSEQFPPNRCNAWEDCNHDGICHDPFDCCAIGPNQQAGDDEDTFTRAEVEAAVKRAIEACTRKAEKLSECCQSCAGVGREVRAIFQEPDAIAKIVKGEN